MVSPPQALIVGEIWEEVKACREVQGIDGKDSEAQSRIRCG